MANPESLNILISGDHEIPLYLQIAYQLTYLIYSHQLRDNEQLPAVRLLAEQLKVNPNTVQQAYNELQNNGLVASQRGRGTFVRALNANEAADWGVRHQLFMAEMARMRQRVHSLGFVDSDVQSQFFGLTSSGPQMCEIAVITQGLSARKYASYLSAKLAPYDLYFHPLSTEDVAAQEPAALETLAKCFYVITLVTTKKLVEELLGSVRGEHSVIVASLDITTETIGRIAELPAGLAVCVFSPERYQPIAVNILHSYSLVEHRSITKVIDTVPKDIALQALTSADIVVHTYMAGRLLEAYGVPREKRLEIGFEVSKESVDRLKVRFEQRRRTDAALADAEGLGDYELF